MGCNFTRQEYSPENMMQDGEKSLLLSETQTITAFFVFADHSSNGEDLSKAELLSALDILSQSTNFFNKPDSMRNYFYTSVLEEPFPLKKLQILSILLGVGEQRTKAKLLFRIYNKDRTKEISRDTVTQMIMDIKDCCNKDLPSLSSSLLEKRDTKFALYWNKLNLLNEYVFCLLYTSPSPRDS